MRQNQSLGVVDISTADINKYLHSPEQKKIIQYDNQEFNYITRKFKFANTIIHTTYFRKNWKYSVGGSQLDKCRTCGKTFESL